MRVSQVQMIKAVLFDLDGTLLDTARDLVAALNYVRSLEGLPELDTRALAFAVSQGAGGLIEAGMPASPEVFESRKQQLLAHYADNLYQHTIPFAGIEAMLAELEMLSLPWGVVTNKPHRFSEPVMSAAGFSQRVACLISGDTLARAKPWPDQLYAACEQLQLTPAETIYIGDDQRDTQAATAAGMAGYHVVWGYGEPARGAELLQTPADIIGLIGSS